MQQDNVFLAIKGVLVGTATAFSAAFGWVGGLALCWVGCMALDFITGTIAACANEQWSSKAARTGIWHKAGMFLVVVAAAMVDMVLGTILAESGLGLPINYTMLLAPMVMIWYIVTELGSVAENAAAMGAPVPGFLLKFLLAAKDKVEDLELGE